MHKRKMYVFLILLVGLLASAVLAGVLIFSTRGIGVLTDIFDLENSIVKLLICFIFTLIIVKSYLRWFHRMLLSYLE